MAWNYMGVDISMLVDLKTLIIEIMEGVIKSELVIEILMDFLHYIAPMLNSDKRNKTEVHEVLQKNLNAKG